MRNKILLVIVAALLSAQAEDYGWYSGQHGQWYRGGLAEDYGVVGVPQVVESGQHTQWGTLRYRVPPGQYTVIGELIQGGGVVGIPRVRNPNPQVVAERVQESTVRYTRHTPPPREDRGNDVLILRDAQGNPLAYFNDIQEARQYLGDQLYDLLRTQNELVEGGSPGTLPHYNSCTSEDCREISLAAAEWSAYNR